METHVMSRGHALHHLQVEYKMPKETCGRPRWMPSCGNSRASSVLRKREQTLWARAAMRTGPWSAGRDARHHSRSMYCPNFKESSRNVRRCMAEEPSRLSGSDASMLDVPGLVPAPRRSESERIAEALRKWLPSWIPPELVKRMYVTFLMLLLARVGHYIPLPGLDVRQLMDPTANQESIPKSLTAALTGTASEIGGNIYLLSITPYMTAGLTLAALQLIPETRRHLDSLRDEGRSGRETINNYSGVLFIIAALIQAFMNASKLNSIALHAGRMFQLQTAVTLMAGAVLCKFAVQRIDHLGLGDGTGVIIGAGIALSTNVKILESTRCMKNPFNIDYLRGVDSSTQVQ